MRLLFSYGALQQEAVQLSTFGRGLTGRPHAEADDAARRSTAGALT